MRLLAGLSINGDLCVTRHSGESRESRLLLNKRGSLQNRSFHPHPNPLPQGRGGYAKGSLTTVQRALGTPVNPFSVVVTEV